MNVPLQAEARRSERIELTQMNDQLSDPPREALPYEHAIQLLNDAGVDPITELQLVAVLRHVFALDHTVQQQQSALASLVAAGFISRSAQCTITRGPRRKTRPELETPPRSLPPQSIARLAQGLLSIADTSAVHSIALTWGERGQYEAALHIYKAFSVWLDDQPARELLPDRARVVCNHGVALCRLARFSEAIALIEPLERKYADCTDSNVLKHVAAAMVVQAYALEELDQAAEALALNEHVHDRFGHSDVPAIRTTVVKALTACARLHFACDRASEAFELYDAIEADFGADVDGPTREALAAALYNKAWSLHAEGRFLDQLICCEQITKRFGQDVSERTRTLVVESTMARCETLARLNRFDEAEAYYRAACERLLAGATSPQRGAMGAAGMALGVGMLRRHGGAAARRHCRRILERFGEDGDPQVQRQIIEAFSQTLQRIAHDNHQPEQVLEWYQAFIGDLDQCGSSVERESTAAALEAAATLFAQRGALPQAIACRQAIADRFFRTGWADLRGAAARAYFANGFMLAQADQREDACAWYLEVDRCFGNDSDANVQLQVAAALVNLGQNLKNLSQFEHAIAVHRVAIERYRNVSSAPMRERVAFSLCNLAEALRHGQRLNAAQGCYQQLLDGEARQPFDAPARTRATQECLVTAQCAMGTLFEARGQVEQALTAYAQVSEANVDGMSAGVRAEVNSALERRSALAATGGAASNEPGAFVHATNEIGVAEVAGPILSIEAGDIQSDWIAGAHMLPSVLHLASQDLARDGPEEFRDRPLSDFGWQPLVFAPGWWLIRVVPSGPCWGYGLYYLWHPGSLMHLEGNGHELRALQTSGCVQLDTTMAAAQWYRLRGACELVGGFPRYRLVNARGASHGASDAPSECAGTVHRRSDLGWEIKSFRRTNSKLERVQCHVHDAGQVAHEAVTDVTTPALEAADPVLMMFGSLAGFSSAMFHMMWSTASKEEKAAVARINWDRFMRLAKIVTFPIAMSLVALVWGWRSTRSLLVLPFLPGLVISRYRPLAVDVRAQAIHQLLAFLEQSATRRVATVITWFGLLTIATAHGSRGWNVLAAAFIVVGYAHATYAFVKNEAVRLRIFRYSQDASEFLSRLHDFVPEYALCVVAFLLAFPLVLARFTAMFAWQIDGLPLTVGESYRFTAAALAQQVPGEVWSKMSVFPELKTLPLPNGPWAERLQLVIQQIFSTSMLSLLIAKVWAVKQLRDEADERLARSLKDAVALGERVANRLFTIIERRVDLPKARMGILALGLVGDAGYRSKLEALASNADFKEFDSHLRLAVALLGDASEPLPATPMILAPSVHGGDDPLNLTDLVLALRAPTPAPETAPSLRRLLTWQGVSTQLRQAAMMTLLRIPGAFSASNAIDWTHEFVGGSIISREHTQVLELFGHASLSLPVEALASSIVHEWLTAPAINLIALARYQYVATDFRRQAIGADGMNCALFMALFHAIDEVKNQRRYHHWRLLNAVMRKMAWWEAAARAVGLCLVLEVVRKTYEPATEVEQKRDSS